jgi:hypothetical protein
MRWWTFTLAERVEDLDAAFDIHEMDDHPSKAANRKRADILAEVLGRGLRRPGRGS